MATSKGGYVSGGFDILKAPNAPTITSVTTSIGSASVAFTAPTDVGGGAITSYTITAVNESTGASTGVTGTESPINISPGTGTFKIRAAATNIYGPGRVSQYDTGNVIDYSGAELWAWGNNSDGRLGDGTVANKSSPVQVGALTNWAQVSAGGTHVLSRKTDGTIWAWGQSQNGQLGQNDLVSRSSPVQVGALTNWSEVSAGSNISGAVKTDGTLWMWGPNTFGSLGQGNVISRSSPVQVGALTNWARISINLACAAIKTDGTLWAWGLNSSGQLGDGTVISRSSPVQIGFLTNWAQVSSVSSNMGAVKADGTFWTWGANAYGQLGQNNRVDLSSPTQVGALTNWSQVSFGDGSIVHFVARKSDGTVWSSGWNRYGQLGDNTTVGRSSPVQVGALTDWSQVTAGIEFSGAVKTDGTLWMWGDNGFGQLGQNNTFNRKSSPVQIGASTSWYQVSAGGYDTLALYGVV